MNNYLNYSLSDRKTIEKIVSVKEWNKDAKKEDIINVSYGFVMPVYGGYDWKPTKKALINKYCFSSIK